MTVTNATFVIERILNASPARVFAAYTSLEAKSAWFKAPSDIETLNRDFDFRVGGKERFHARWPSGMITDFQATYHDIVEDERIILVYDMFHNGDKLSVSLLTIELSAEGDKTRLIHTEQGSYLTGGDDAVKSREHGTTWHIDNLVAVLEGREARAFA
ncbi:SRPBCC family protein [Sphingomonas sp.]|uniref:SRPBCC family protein n=1 Tax=Sphingomonas sp. TaxID=28214 RepID=UPI0031E13C1B